MRGVLCLRNVVFGAFALLVGVSFCNEQVASAPAPPAPWGNVKGRIVWGANAIPERAEIKVDRDAEACLKKGPLLSENLVIDPKTRAVRDVFVWLMVDSREQEDLLKPLAIYPDLQPIKDKSVAVDVTCCKFEPHAFGLREGQRVRFDYGKDVAHHVVIESDQPRASPVVNPINIREYGPYKAQTGCLPVQCCIHAWMSATCRVFNHPFFCVTGDSGAFEIRNAPAGTCRVVVWHESQGWVTGDKQPDRFGQRIEITPQGTTDLGILKISPRKE